MAVGDRNKVFVELDPTTKLPIRIIKRTGDASQLPEDIRGHVARAWAVGEIRRQVFQRDGYECRRCGEKLTAKTGHMDEIKSKGEGGEVSVDNCWILCFACHEGNKPTSEHGNRRLQFASGERK